MTAFEAGRVVSASLGAILLFIFSLSDYRRQVTVFCNDTVYHLYMVLFLATNLIIYVVIIWTYYSAVATPNASNIPACLVYFFSPIFIAIGYFAVGSKSINIGEKEASINGKLLEIIKNILPAKLSIIINVDDAIYNIDVECDHMRKHLEVLRSAAKKTGNALPDRWEEVQIQCQHLDQRCKILSGYLKEIEGYKVDLEEYCKLKEEKWEEWQTGIGYLDKIESMLSSIQGGEQCFATIKSQFKEWRERNDLIGAANKLINKINEFMDRLKQEIDTQVFEAKQTMLKLYKEYLRELIHVNMRNEKEVDDALKRFDTCVMKEPAKPINVHYRCLGLGMISGIALGFVSAVILENDRLALLMMVAGIVGISLSNFVFSFIYGLLNNKEISVSIYVVPIIGFIAGYLGHLVFTVAQLIVQKKLIVLKKLGMEYAPKITYEQAFLYSILGAGCGLFLALFFCIYKYWLSPKIKKDFLGFGLLGLGGALIIGGTVFLFQKPFEEMHGPINLVGTLVIGFIIAAILGYGLDLYGGGQEATSYNTNLHLADSRPEPADEPV